MTEPIIETHGLTKRFGRFTAVDHITLSVMPGEIFGFLGANGAGKTTAMRMLCGLSRPTEGWGRVAGCDITRQPEAVKRHIGYMSQRFSLYDDLTVAENIRLFGGIYGLSRAELARRTDELTGSLGMEAERRKRVAALPLGLKQRLAFSVAMLHRPPLVFLDEPTGGVDPNTATACRSWSTGRSGRSTRPNGSNNSSAPRRWRTSSSAWRKPQNAHSHDHVPRLCP